MNNITSPRTDDAGIEQEIVARGLTAPRITPNDIEANIASEHYFTALDGLNGADSNNHTESTSDIIKSEAADGLRPQAAAVRRSSMNFGQALDTLKSGGKVQRAGWNGAGLWLELQVPDAHSKMTLPYIFMSYPLDAKTTPGARVPWFASQTDLLAEDWRIV